MGSQFLVFDMLLTGKVPFVGFPMGRGTTNRMIFSALALLSRPGNSYQSFSALPYLLSLDLHYLHVLILGRHGNPLSNGVHS